MLCFKAPGDSSGRVRGDVSALSLYIYTYIYIHNERKRHPFLQRGSAAHSALRRQATLMAEYEAMLQRNGWSSPAAAKESPKPTAAQLELEKKIGAYRIEFTWLSNLPKVFHRCVILRNFCAGIRTDLGYGLGFLRVRSSGSGLTRNPNPPLWIIYGFAGSIY